MRRSVSLLISLSALVTMAAFIALPLILGPTQWRDTAHPPRSLTLYLTLGFPTVAVTLLLDYVALIAALITLARKREWLWFAALWLSAILSVLGLLITLPIYLFVGPFGRPAPQRERLVTDAARGGDEQASSGLRGGSATRSRPWAALLGASRYASPVERTAAAAIDLVTFQAAGLAVALAVNAPFIVSTHPAHASWGDGILILVIAYAFIGGFVYVLWPAQWARGGQTFGQRALRIRVVPLQGTRIGFGRAFLRTLCIFTLDIPFGIPIGWFWAIIDPRRQAWHDKIVRTVVVRDEVSAKSQQAT